MEVAAAVLRSSLPTKEGSDIMSTSEVFNVVDNHSGTCPSDHEDNTTAISTSAQTSDRPAPAHTHKPSSSSSAVGKTGAGWMVVSSKKRGTVSVLLYRPSSLISSVATFRGKIPVLAGGKLVPGCAYYRQRLAYFEVEVLHSYGEKPKLAIGWAGNDHP